MDFDADLMSLSDADVIAYQQEATRTRLAANEAGRRAQAELDRRAEARAEQRAQEDAELGAVRKPPTQHVFGEPQTEIGPDDVESVPSGILRKP